MEKTVSVNIGGVAFVLDESAYFTLKRYLVDVESRLEESERKDTMQGIEERIAEIFKSNMGHGIEIVGLDLVKSTMATIGASSTFGQTKSTLNNSSMKRIYRDTENGIIGGVCSGLSEYLEIDLAIVRILAFVLFFCLGLSLWVYIIMWLFVPAKK